MKKGRLAITFTIGAIIFALFVCIDLFSGGAPDKEIVRLIRLPRVLTASIAGAALSLSGLQMQSIFRNPLADPHIMGISSGAALGAAIATMATPSTLGIVSGYTLTAAAFAGAIISALVILAASRKFRSAGTLLIFGVMVSFMVNAIVSTFQFRTDAESLKMFYSWSAGSFSNSTTNSIVIMGIALFIGTTLSLFNHKGTDIILFGDEFATLSGAEPGKIRICALLSCSIMTGAVTAFCGPLGFIGIVSPHIARGIIGSSSHKYTVPASIMTGSIIGTGADILSQISAEPLPLTATMAFVGVPVIIYIMIRRPSFSQYHE